MVGTAQRTRRRCGKGLAPIFMALIGQPIPNIFASCVREKKILHKLRSRKKKLFGASRPSTLFPSARIPFRPNSEPSTVALNPIFGPAQTHIPTVGEPELQREKIRTPAAALSLFLRFNGDYSRPLGDRHGERSRGTRAHRGEGHRAVGTPPRGRSRRRRRPVVGDHGQRRRRRRGLHRRGVRAAAGGAGGVEAEGGRRCVSLRDLIDRSPGGLVLGFWISFRFPLSTDTTMVFFFFSGEALRPARRGRALSRARGPAGTGRSPSGGLQLHWLLQFDATPVISSI